MTVRERSRGWQLREDTGLFFDFLDFASASQRPDVETFNRITRQTGAVHHALAYVIAHEVCHFAWDDPTAPDSATYALPSRAREERADMCAAKMLKDSKFDSDYTILALDTLLSNGFSPSGEFVFHESHPHTLCRMIPHFEMRMKIRDLDDASVSALLGKPPGLETQAFLKAILTEYVNAGVAACEGRSPADPSPAFQQWGQRMKESMERRVP